MGKRKSSTQERNSIPRIFTVLGAIMTLVGYGVGLVNSILALNAVGILVSIACILIACLVLIQVNLIKSKKFDIPFNWWMLLLFIIIQAVIANFNVALTSLVLSIELGSFLVLGLLLEVIAAIILIFKAL